MIPSRARPAWVPSDLYPFADHYADVGGCVVHYLDEGAGPPLLMLHGNPTWSFLYREIIAGLRDRYRCIAVDYPGFGLSTPRPGYGFTPAERADVVEQLVAQLDLSAVTLRRSACLACATGARCWSGRRAIRRSAIANGDVGGAVPGPPDGDARRRRSLHPGGRARGDRGGGPGDLTLLRRA